MIPRDGLARAERTEIRFAQEIYDAIGRLVAVHEKFPVDLSHKEL